MVLAILEGRLPDLMNFFGHDELCFEVGASGHSRNGLRDICLSVFDFERMPRDCYVRLTVNLKLSESDRTEFLIKHKVFGSKMFQW